MPGIWDFLELRGTITLQGTNISPKNGTFEDAVPFPMVGYVSSLEGILLYHILLMFLFVCLYLCLFGCFFLFVCLFSPPAQNLWFFQEEVETEDLGIS